MNTKRQITCQKMLISHCLNLRKEVAENCQGVVTVKDIWFIHAIPGVFCGFSHLHYYYPYLLSSNTPVKHAAFYHSVL